MTYHEALESVRTAIRELNEEDQRRIAETIWSEFMEDSDDQFELTEEMKAELDRRIAEDDANPDEGVPWEQVRDEARARRGR